MAYFDNAATTYPKPDRVYSFMDEFYRKCGGNVGRGDYGIAKSAGALVADTRTFALSGKAGRIYSDSNDCAKYYPSGTVQDGKEEFLYQPF